MELLGVLVLWRGRARVSIGLGGRGFGERLEAPEVFIYGTGEEIVAHIPRNLGSGETPSAKPSSSCLGFMLSHIRFDWSRFGCVAVRSFFGSDTIMVRIAKWVIQKLLVKIRQDKYKK
jgi:hypothetical protein